MINTTITLTLLMIIWDFLSGRSLNASGYAGEMFFTIFKKNSISAQDVHKIMGAVLGQDY